MPAIPDPPGLKKPDPLRGAGLSVAQSGDRFSPSPGTAPWPDRAEREPRPGLVEGHPKRPGPNFDASDGSTVEMVEGGIPHLLSRPYETHAEAVAEAVAQSEADSGRVPDSAHTYADA
jgi:hypothetical protein